MTPSTVAEWIAAVLAEPAVRREIAAIVREVSPPPAPEADGLVSAAGLARRLGVSVATVRRLAPPHTLVGVSRRYDVAVVREWLAEREPAPTTPARRARTTVDVGDVLAAAGIEVGR